MRSVLSATVLVLTLAGCAQTDPYTRDGMWQPEGVNERNLDAMVANPADLVYGHGDTRPDSQLATTAVTQLLAGRAKPLPALSSDTAPGGAVGATSAGPAPTSGAN